MVGIERVPPTAPLIVAGNHLSYVDALLTPSLVPRLDIYLLVAEEFERQPFYHFFANFIGHAIYLALDSKAAFALRQAVAMLRAGHVVVIAPEGRVSLTMRRIAAMLPPAYRGVYSE